MLAGVARTEWTVEGAYDTVVVKAKSAWDSVAHLGEHKELNKLQQVKKTLSNYAHKAGDVGSAVGHALFYKLEDAAENAYACLKIGLDEAKKKTAEIYYGKTAQDVANKCQIVFTNAKDLIAEKAHDASEVGKVYAEKAYETGKDYAGSAYETGKEYAGKALDFYKEHKEVIHSVIQGIFSIFAKKK